jgi:2-polyprenyl-3-methyl-5-hydroxy-6-metoxy-1,4-benzoquinol methylase
VSRASLDYVSLNDDPYSGHQLLLARIRGARTVLDVGCSAGTLSEVLARDGATVDGIESDPVAGEQARDHCRVLLVGDVETVDLGPLPGGYDAVLMADVLEHLRDPVGVMARLRPLLAPGGRLLLSTPNIANWSMRLLHLLGRWDYRERGIMDRTHVRFFTRRTLVRAVEAASYRVEEVDVTCPLPVLRRQPFNAAAHAAARAWKNLLAYQFIVVARPR